MPPRVTLHCNGRSGPGGRGASLRDFRRSQPPRPTAGPGARASSPRSIVRILEEAISQRWARMLGLYSSHLTEWRRARPSLQGLTPSKRGRKPAERNPLSAKDRARESRLEKELHTAHKILDDGQLPDCWDSASNREGTAMAVGVRRRRRGAGIRTGGAGFLLRQRPAPGHQQPRSASETSSTCSPARAFDRSPAEVVATLLDGICGRAHRVPDHANQPVESGAKRSHPC